MAKLFAAIVLWIVNLSFQIMLVKDAWNWFVYPHVSVPITIAQAGAAMVIVNALQAHYSYKKYEEDTDVLASTVSDLLRTAFCWGILWILAN